MQLLLSLLMLGCAGSPSTDSVGTTASSPGVDQDQDGYVAGVDCDDGDLTVYPDAPELCDGVDNDCDGGVDDGDPQGAVDGQEWWADEDGDGYGTGVSAVACVAPTGTAASTGDCDDSDPTAYPDAPELCDEVDNDCDGGVDDDDAQGAVDAPTWYLDEDGDGYGGDQSVVSCVAPAGAQDTLEDCDDRTALAAPGLTEVCGDGLDNDCDGSASGCRTEGVLSLADASVARWDLPPTDCGSRVLSVGWGNDLDGDGVDEVIVGGLGDARAGQAWMVPVDKLDSGQIDDLASAVRGLSDQSPPSPECFLSYGYAMDGSADLDGDGYSDLVAGASNMSLYGLDGKKTPGSGKQGAVFISWGPVTGTDGVWTSAHRIMSPTEVVGIGTSVDVVSDLGSDGLPELLVGMDAVDGGVLYGGAYLFDSPIADVSSPDDARATWYVDYRSTVGGAHVSVAGDLDGDGVPELLIGDADGRRTLDNLRDVLYVVSSTATGSTALPDGAQGRILGNFDEDSDVGNAFHGEFDWNGDGYDDVVVGAPLSNGTDLRMGLAGIVPGPIDGDRMLYDAPVRIDGSRAEAMLGSSVLAQDLDGDGFMDLAASAPCSSFCKDGDDVGELMVFYGPLDGVRAQDEADLLLTGPGPMMVARDGLLDAVTVGGVTHLVVGYPYGDPRADTPGAVLMVPLPGW